MNRRLFAAIAGIGTVAAGLAYWRLRHVYPYEPVLEHVVFPLPVGAEKLHGMRIAFITDTHTGPFTSGEDISAVLHCSMDSMSTSCCWGAITFPNPTYMRLQWRTRSRHW